GAVAFASPGITVNTATRNNANEVKLNITVDASTPIGPCNITGTNADNQISTLPGGGPVGCFASGSPTINSVTPSQAYQNWIGTVTATGSAFQVDPGSTVVFEPITAGATLDVIGAPTIVSTTTAVATVSATDVGDFRVWVINADSGKGFYDFFVVNSFSPPTPEWIAFNGVTNDATASVPQLISPTPRITAVFTDNEQLFNTATSQNTAKIVYYGPGQTGIDYVPAPNVRFEAGNTRAIIDYQIPRDKAFPAGVNIIQAYMENSSGEASRIAASVRIGYVLMDKVPAKAALASKTPWDPIRDPGLELQWKMVGPVTVPPTVKIDVFKSDMTRPGSVTANTHVALSYDSADPSNSFKIVKAQIRASDFIEFSQGMYLFIIHNEDIYAKGKVMVQHR
ncbi:MAG: hypothetical protein LAP85_09585, partial [Acidobacteriia bacterium]|nr:hypothetical protein [Terriglobia bacterium]